MSELALLYESIKTSELENVSNDIVNASNDNQDMGLQIGTLKALQAAALASAMCFISVLTITGNTLVLVAVRTERKLQTIGNMFIVSLALSDLIVGSAVMPISAIYVLHDKWIFRSQVLCRIWIAVDYVASTASILNLMVLSLDRYWSIRAPFHYKVNHSRKKAFLMLAAAWSIATLWVIPIFGWKYFDSNFIRREQPLPMDVCHTEYAEEPVFKIVTAVFNFFLPLTAMYILYADVFRIARNRVRSLRRGAGHSAALVQLMAKNVSFMIRTKAGENRLRQSNSNTGSRTEQRKSSRTSDTALTCPYSVTQYGESERRLSNLSIDPSASLLSVPTLLQTTEADENPVASYPHPDNISSAEKTDQGSSSVEFSDDEDDECIRTTEALRNICLSEEDLELCVETDMDSNGSLDNLPPCKKAHSVAEVSSLITTRQPRPRRYVRKRSSRYRMRAYKSGSLSLVDRKTVYRSKSCTNDNERRQDSPKIRSSLGASASMRSRLLAKRISVSIKRSSSAALSTIRNKFTVIHEKAVANLKGELKAAKQLGVIMTAFTVCFFPYFTLYIIIAVCNNCISNDLMTFVTWIGYVNSTLNPLLYSACNDSFREKFKQMLMCRPRTPQHFHSGYRSIKVSPKPPHIRCSPGASSLRSLRLTGD